MRFLQIEGAAKDLKGDIKGKFKDAKGEAKGESCLAQKEE